MSVVIVTGSAGLIGSETATYFAQKGMNIVGIDNDMRGRFFGKEASTQWNRRQLEEQLKASYEHADLDIRNADELDKLFKKYAGNITLIVHCAAQPSHDWAARDPLLDFSVNATGTLHVLEAARKHAPSAVFIHLSTNKVYGDRPNTLPLQELDQRWELPEDHTYYSGIREDLSIDESLHSLMGASKVAADILVQEYGRYFGLNTACFRGGCLTGPGHSGTEAHGFLAYLMKCAGTGRPYTVFGYKAKQVRDNIHSQDLVRAFDCLLQSPRQAAVYNIGGGRFSNCSVLEAIGMCEKIAGRPLSWTYSETARTGDHQWWISDTSRFEKDFPSWTREFDIQQTLRQIHDANTERWHKEAAL